MARSSSAGWILSALRQAAVIDIVHADSHNREDSPVDSEPADAGPVERKAVSLGSTIWRHLHRLAALCDETLLSHRTL